MRLRSESFLPSSLRCGRSRYRPRGAGPTYRNPISASFADTFADPSIIEAKDGWWYAYSTADPLREGGDAGHHAHRPDS